MRSEQAADTRRRQDQIRKILTDYGFPAEFADVIAERTGTPYTAGRMLGYLRNCRPRREEDVVDIRTAFMRTPSIAEGLGGGNAAISLFPGYLYMC